MRLIPTCDQWRAWSLPSKLTAIGALAGLLSITFYFFDKVVPIGSIVISRLFAPPGFAYMRGDIEYLSVSRPNVGQSGVVLLKGPTDEMRSAYRMARDVFEGREITMIVLRPRKDFVAASDGEDLCKVLLYRFRDDAGLDPKQEIIQTNPGCDARFVRLSDSIGEAIVAWSWGGIAVALDLSIVLWDRSAFVPVDIELRSETGARFAFADLDGDGITEPVTTSFTDGGEENPPALTIYKLSSDRPLVYRPLDQSKPEFKSYFDEVVAVSDPSLWEWVAPEEVGVKADDSESIDKP